ncbi:MAG: hypothetical protein ACRBBW_12235 [Cellvibrionaceae bacterium]
MLISIVFSVVIIAAVFAILLWVKTPHYQLQPEQVMQLLEWMILGQATDNDWRVFCGYPIRHSELLEQVRQACVEIDEQYYIGDTRAGHLLNKEGLEQLTELLRYLKTSLKEE